jgi:cytochrome c(L)
MVRHRRRARVRSALLAFLVLVGLLVAGAGRWALAGPQKWNDAKNPYEGDPAAIEEGREIFSARCSFCHGTLGRGAKGPCLTCGHYYYRGGSNAQLFATITAGIAGGQMGAFASSLTGEQIWKVIAFLRDQTEKDHPEALKQD